MIRGPQPARASRNKRRETHGRNEAVSAIETCVAGRPPGSLSIRDVVQECSTKIGERPTRRAVQRLLESGRLSVDSRMRLTLTEERRNERNKVQAR